MRHDLPQSLHSHTTRSDGRLHYHEVMSVAKKSDIGVVAFTDHDALPDNETMKYLDSVRDESFPRWIVGIEISAGLPEEIAKPIHGDMHIVGLFVDPTDSGIVEHCRKAQQARIERMEKIVSHLQSEGFSITNEACREKAGGDSVGRPHVVRALLEKEENMRLLLALAEKMRIEAVSNEHVKRKYEKMMQEVNTRGVEQYVYDLLLANDAYLKGVYMGYSYYLDFDKSVKLIREAGGIASIAHYFTVRKDMDFDFVEKLLSEKRVDGMETVYGMSRKKGRVPKRNNSELVSERGKIRELLIKHDALPTGGSDAHQQSDYELFGENREFSGETIGMAENIIDKKGLSTRWSSF